MSQLIIVADNYCEGHWVCVYIYIYIYIYTTILPPSCTDGRQFYHISGTALYSGINYDFFGSIAIFLLISGTPSPTQESTFKWKSKAKGGGGSGVPRGLKKVRLG